MDRCSYDKMHGMCTVPSPALLCKHQKKAVAFMCACALQVYTYNLRPIGHLVRVDDTSANGSGTGGSSNFKAAQQPQQQCAVRGSGASCDSCTSNAAVTGYELQLVMEYCPMVS
jgi:hypothetical protein